MSIGNHSKRLDSIGLALFALSMSWLLACGPITYINQVSRTAHAEVAAAQAVQAEIHAPYWYTLATEYLHKAREEAAYSDYQAANRFGKKATEAARTARKLSLKRASTAIPKSKVGGKR